MITSGERSNNSTMSQKTIAITVVLALLWLAESLIPLIEDRKHRAAHGGANLALGIVNGAIHSFLLAGATLMVTEWARTQPFGLLHWVVMPTVATIITAVLLFDMWQYWWHRIAHAVPFIWRLHSVHHTDEEMDASSGVRFHTAEILLSGVARLAVLPLIGMTVGQVLIYETIALPVILFHHSNVRVPPALDRVLRMIIVTPSMHWVHHSRWQPETDSNFSSILSWWDRIFGTFRLRDDPRTIDLGLDGYEESEWRTLRGMLLSPFRSRAQEDAGPADSAED